MANVRMRHSGTQPVRGTKQRGTDWLVRQRNLDIFLVNSASARDLQSMLSRHNPSRFHSGPRFMRKPLSNNCVQYCHANRRSALNGIAYGRTVIPGTGVVTPSRYTSKRCVPITFTQLIRSSWKRIFSAIFCLNRTFLTANKNLVGCRPLDE